MMRLPTLNVFLLLMLGFMVSPLSGQSSAEIFNAFNARDYEKLISHMDNSLDVCIEEVQQFNKKEVAITRLKAYFESNPITKWEPLHQGASKKSQSNFHIAKIITKNGSKRLFIYLEKGNQKNILKEIRIENL